jgi:hypothetical protein
MGLQWESNKGRKKAVWRVEMWAVSKAALKAALKAVKRENNSEALTENPLVGKRDDKTVDLRGCRQGYWSVEKTDVQ